MVNIKREPASIRVTIMLDKKLDKKLRALQAKRIVEEGKTYSFSKAINEILTKGLK